MPESFLAIAFLACPIGMGLMMWLMMRGSPSDADDKDTQSELQRLQSQIDDLRASGASSTTGKSSRD